MFVVGIVLIILGYAASIVGISHLTEGFKDGFDRNKISSMSWGEVLFNTNQQGDIGTSVFSDIAKAVSGGVVTTSNPTTPNTNSGPTIVPA